MTPKLLLAHISHRFCIAQATCRGSCAALHLSPLSTFSWYFTAGFKSCSEDTEIPTHKAESIWGSTTGKANESIWKKLFKLLGSNYWKNTASVFKYNPSHEVLLPVTLEENLYTEIVDATVLREQLLWGQRKAKKKVKGCFLRWQVNS